VLPAGFGSGLAVFIRSGYFISLNRKNGSKWNHSNGWRRTVWAKLSA
jgi:hypothetical protein